MEIISPVLISTLQQLLPFTVLKHTWHISSCHCIVSCNSTYRLRYWNRVPTISRTREDLLLQQSLPFTVLKPLFPISKDLSIFGCNSAYRLQYAQKGARQQRSKATMRSAHLKYLNEEKVKQRWWGNSTYRLWYWNSSYMPQWTSLLHSVARAPTACGIETLL